MPVLSPPYSLILTFEPFIELFSLSDRKEGRGLSLTMHCRRILKLPIAFMEKI